MRRGIFALVGDISQGLMDRITAAENKADQAQTAANTATTAGSNASTAATNLAGAVSAGDATHAAINARIDSIAVGTGRMTVALLLGNTVDVVVTLSQAMPNTTYTVKVAPTTGFTFGTPKNRTATTVTIPVTAGLALAVGASFTVIAHT